MEAMETEFETSRHYMQAEMGRTRDDLEKMRDKFRRYEPRPPSASLPAPPPFFLSE